MAQLLVDPPQAIFHPPNSQVSSRHNLLNATEVRLALKVKCSDNNQYRLRPVFALLEPLSAIGLEVARQPGPITGKQDKLVIQYGVASAEEQDAQNVFRGAGPFGEVLVPLTPSAEPPVAVAAPAEPAAVDGDFQMPEGM